jgi:hypothetical protein
MVLRRPHRGNMVTVERTPGQIPGTNPHYHRALARHYYRRAYNGRTRRPTSDARKNSRSRGHCGSLHFQGPFRIILDIFLQDITSTMSIRMSPHKQYNLDSGHRASDDFWFPPNIVTSPRSSHHATSSTLYEHLNPATLFFFSSLTRITMHPIRVGVAWASTSAFQQQLQGSTISFWMAASWVFATMADDMECIAYYLDIVYLYLYAKLSVWVSMLLSAHIPMVHSGVASGADLIAVKTLVATTNKNQPRISMITRCKGSWAFMDRRCSIGIMLVMRWEVNIDILSSGECVCPSELRQFRSNGIQVTLHNQMV